MPRSRAEPDLFDSASGSPEPSPMEAQPSSLRELRAEAADCTCCPLFENATQTVFGEGPSGARIVFVGEQPGDQEDLAGRPFVGPAGQIFDAALIAAGIDRKSVYVTNAVKHFKFEPRGKRRLHQKPNAGEIRACHFWLDLELRLIAPKLVVALGATALASLIGKSIAVSALRGGPTVLESGLNMWVSIHPSAILRMPDRNLAAEQRRRFEEDFKAIGAFANAAATK